MSTTMESSREASPIVETTTTIETATTKQPVENINEVKKETTKSTQPTMEDIPG